MWTDGIAAHGARAGCPVSVLSASDRCVGRDGLLLAYDCSPKFGLLGFCTVPRTTHRSRKALGVCNMTARDPVSQLLLYDFTHTGVILASKTRGNRW